VAHDIPQKPYKRMTRQDLADLVILNELSENDTLPAGMVPEVNRVVEKWMLAAWDSIRWEARHAGYDPEKMKQPELSRDGLIAAEYLYMHRPFQPSYGGPKWANISHNALEAYDSWKSGAVRGMLQDMMNLIYTEHNTGMLGEKLLIDSVRGDLRDLKDNYLVPEDLVQDASKDVAEAGMRLPHREPAKKSYHGYSGTSVIWEPEKKSLAGEPKKVDWDKEFLRSHFELEDDEDDVLIKPKKKKPGGMK